MGWRTILRYMSGLRALSQSDSVTTVNLFLRHAVCISTLKLGLSMICIFERCAHEDLDVNISSPGRMQVEITLAQVCVRT